MFFSTLSLWLITRDSRRNIWQNIVIGASIFFVVFIRATGILLLGSFLFVEFLKLIAHRRDWGTVQANRSGFPECPGLIYCAVCDHFPVVSQWWRLVFCPVCRDDRGNDPEFRDPLLCCVQLVFRRGTGLEDFILRAGHLFPDRRLETMAGGFDFCRSSLSPG